MTQYNIDQGATPEGFTGTIPAFLQWLHENLAYGGVTISAPQESTHHAKGLVHRINLITAGYSDDEELIGRVVNGSMFALRYWRETHAGGLYAFEVPAGQFSEDKPTQWLKAATQVFQEVHRARTLIVRNAASGGTATNTAAAGTHFELQLPAGARLLFSEEGPDGGRRDIGTPTGVLTIEMIPEEDSL